MALRKVYNPPPNWPAPPPGWQPPVDWQPDPAWGPAPEGWQFWRQERANPRAFGYAAVAAGIWFVAFLSIGSIAARSAPSAYVGGLIFGRCLAAWLVTSIIAFVSSHRWRLWLYVVVALGVSLVLAAVVTAGQQGQG